MSRYFWRPSRHSSQWGIFRTPQDESHPFNTGSIPIFHIVSPIVISESNPSPWSITYITIACIILLIVSAPIRCSFCFQSHQSALMWSTWHLNDRLLLNVITRYLIASFRSIVCPFHTKSCKSASAVVLFKLTQHHTCPYHDWCLTNVSSPFENYL